MIPYTDGFFESKYAEALAKCLHDGVSSEDRTGVGTRRLQHVTFEWSGIAALRGKKLNLPNAVSELLWMMLGKTDLESLKSRGVNYWDNWVKPDGTFGPIYGAQMRMFGTRVECYDYNGCLSSRNMTSFVSAAVKSLKTRGVVASLCRSGIRTT